MDSLLFHVCINMRPYGQGGIIINVIKNNNIEFVHIY